MSIVVVNVLSPTHVREKRLSRSIPAFCFSAFTPYFADADAFLSLFSRCSASLSFFSRSV